MLSAFDPRGFSSADDRLQHCAFCGKNLVVLPNDSRGGACFDCLSLLGPDTRPCPACGAERADLAECERCGFEPAPH